jgi:hypothetical protein
MSDRSMSDGEQHSEATRYDRWPIARSIRLAAVRALSKCAAGTKAGQSPGPCCSTSIHSAGDYVMRNICPKQNRQPA